MIEYRRDNQLKYGEIKRICENKNTKHISLTIREYDVYLKTDDTFLHQDYYDHVQIDAGNILTKYITVEFYEKEYYIITNMTYMYK